MSELSGHGLTRKVHFFNLAQHGTALDRGHLDSPDWVALTRAEDVETSFESGAGSRMAFAPKGERSVVLAKSLGDANVQAVSSSADIAPVALDDVGAYLAMVTYVYFFESGAFAILSGAPGTPRGSAVAELAGHLAPLDGDRWEARPITSPGDLARFEDVNGISKVTIKAKVGPIDLFSSPQGNLFRFAQEVAFGVGGDVGLDIEIRVRKPGSAARKALKRLFTPDDWRPTASKLQVVSDDELIDLIEHKLASTIELPTTDAGLDLDGLVAAFESVCGSWEDRVNSAR